jgi:probable rRNA maturation factor
MSSHQIDIAGEELAPGIGVLASQLMAEVATLPQCLAFKSPLELSLVLTDDPTIQELNAQWRKIDKATDVLSFPLEEGPVLGDVVISVETARKRVEPPHWLLEDEILFLLIHGVLHLLGYDHMDASDRKEMEQTEQALWTALGRGGTLRPNEAEAPS